MAKGHTWNMARAARCHTCTGMEVLRLIERSNNVDTYCISTCTPPTHININIQALAMNAGAGQCRHILHQHLHSHEHKYQH
jgi:hypothetical protein